MRVLPLFLLFLGACGRAVVGPEVAVAPPVGTVPLAVATGTDLRVEGAMGIAWEHATSFKPWTIAGESVLALSPNGNEIDVIDPRNGHVRTHPLSEAAHALLGTRGALAIATTQNRLLGIDASGNIVWSSAMPHATSVTQVAPITKGVVVLQPVDGRGMSSPHVVALGRGDGKSTWSVTVPPSSYSAQLVPLGSNVIIWSTASGLVRWNILDESDGHTIASGEEAGTRLIARGRRFMVCDERQGVVHVHATGDGEWTPIAAQGRCHEMVVDDDTIYAMRSHRDKEPDEVEAIAIADGRRRWLQKVPAQAGGIVHGDWLVVPSDGGLVRALRRDTGAIVWTHGVGERASVLSTLDDDTIIAGSNRAVTAFRRVTTLPPERTSEVSVHITSWGCVDREGTQLYVGDVPAHADGADRFTAVVRGRGRVTIRVTPYGDLVPVQQSEDRDWSYGPTLVDIDGSRHAMDLAIDSCDED